MLFSDLVYGKLLTRNAYYMFASVCVLMHTTSYGFFTVRISTGLMGTGMRLHIRTSFLYPSTGLKFHDLNGLLVLFLCIKNLFLLQQNLNCNSNYCQTFMEQVDIFDVCQFVNFNQCVCCE